MDRRNFLNLSLVGVSGSLLMSEATASKKEGGGLAGGIFYTKKSPGRWAEKVGGHLPQIKQVKEKEGVKLTVITPHEMKGYEHYIVKHVVLDKDFNFISEKMFNPEQEPMPVSNHQLGEYKGPVYVLSVCNKHDTWMNSVVV
ncbi:MAG: hypothetical protein K6L76_12790 [Agarilytica sp.]